MNRPTQASTEGVPVILLVAVVQLVVVGFVGFRSYLERMTALEGQGAPGIDNLSEGPALFLDLGLGLAFLGLYFWGRARPRPALLIATLLFAGLHGLRGVLDPSTLALGLGFKVSILLVLLFGLARARRGQR